MANITNTQYTAFLSLLKIERPSNGIVIATVKPNSEMSLIRLGCFNGDEKMFRKSEGRSYETNYTVWSGDDNKAFNWSSNTCVSNRVEQMAYYIQALG